MLDQNIIEQLKSVFNNLDQEIKLVYESNVDKKLENKQTELIDLLNQIALTSNKIKIVPTTNPSKNNYAPKFYLEINGKKTGVIFSGIPGGHEFSSLILAILNADGKGKFPDQGILNRIKNLKGPIKLKTYISLSCENCPEVVQALNLMALIHPEFEHEMIDGDFFVDEVEQLKIQSVPTVVANNKILTIGKSSFAEILAKLVDEFGVSVDAENKSKYIGIYDVVVIGGGPAGASSAIYSARKGFKTALLCERFGGQLKDTIGIENLISTSYIEGPGLAENLFKHIKDYPVDIFEHRKVKEIKDVSANEKIKIIELESGEVVHTKSIIVATGAKWRELNVAGEKEYIGRGVAFCPHCDGPFYKGKKVVVVGGGNSGVEAAIDLAKIAKEVILFEFLPDLRADKILVDKCKSLPNISIITNAQVESIEGDGEKVVGLKYLNRISNISLRIDVDGIFVQIGLVPNSGFIKNLVDVTERGEIIIDSRGKTTKNGIYAAGDVTIVPFKQIVIAMGEGAKAALTASEELMFG